MLFNAVLTDCTVKKYSPPGLLRTGIIYLFYRVNDFKSNITCCCICDIANIVLELLKAGYFK